MFVQLHNKQVTEIQALPAAAGLGGFSSVPVPVWKGGDWNRSGEVLQYLSVITSLLPKLYGAEPSPAGVNLEDRLSLCLFTLSN